MISYLLFLQRLANDVVKHHCLLTTFASRQSVIFRYQI